MPGIGDILNIGPQGSGAPGGPQTPMASAAPPQRNISKEWTEFLSQPGARQALIQMGISLLQAVGLGQSTLGNIGGAIGAGGEAATRARKARLEAEESQQDLALRERTVAADERRAEQSGLTANALMTNARMAGKSFEDSVNDYVMGIVQNSPDLEGYDSVYLRVTSDAELMATLLQRWQMVNQMGSGALGGAVGRPPPSP